MSRTTIAPNLRWIIDCDRPPEFREAMATYAEARSELRALLAVARAAQGLVDVEGRDGPEAVRLVKSLARLARASGGKP